VAGSIYLLVTREGDRRYAIAALAASSVGLLLQLNVITLHLRYARLVVWAAIAVCAALVWMRDSSKTGDTVADSMVFVFSLSAAPSATAGWRCKHASISPGPIRYPPLVIRSSSRPMNRKYPASSRVPRSPLTSQSPRNFAAVAASLRQYPRNSTGSGRRYA